MKINKIIIAVICILIIILLGTVIKQQQDINEIKKRIGLNNRQTTQSIVDNNEPKQEIKEISKEEFRKYIKQIDITTDNWKDYFEIEYKTLEDKDAFGEVIGTQKLIIFKLNNKYYGIGELIDTALEIEYPLEKANPEYTLRDIINKTALSINNGSNSATMGVPNWIKKNENITIDDIKCTRAKGTLYYLDNIPSEYWNIMQGSSIAGKTEEYIRVEGKDYFKYQENYNFVKDFIED